MKYLSIFMIAFAHVVAAQEFYGLDTNITTQLSAFITKA